MFKTRDYSLEDLNLVKEVFQNIYNYPNSDFFKIKSWEALVMLGNPFLEELQTSQFLTIFENLGCGGFLILPILMKKDYELESVRRYKTIEYNYIPTVKEFKTMVELEYLNTVDCLIISKDFKAAAYSNVDFELLHLGYDNLVKDKILPIL